MPGTLNDAIMAGVGFPGSVNDKAISFFQSILTGSGAPAAELGSNGNAYLDAVAGVWYMKSAGAWTSVPIGSYAPLANRVFADSYGAKGDWNGTTGTDDTAAINAALASGASMVVLSPGKRYRVNGALVVPNGVVLWGPKAEMVWTGVGVFCTLTNQSQAKFEGITVTLTAAGQTGFYVSNTFRCSWRSCIVQGLHTAATGATYHGQIGFDFEGNAGDNRIIDCDLNNLGEGVRTNTIENYMVGCVFGTCWRGLHGGDPTGVSFAAGMAVIDCTFVSTAAATDHHVLVDGTGNLFWFMNVWMEGCTTGVEVGAGAFGPYNFSMEGCKIASTTASLVINACRQAGLINVDLDVDTGQTPTDLSINATNAANGFAANVSSHQVFDYAAGTFPAGWMYVGRSKGQLPSTLTAPVSVDTSGQAAATPLSINGDTAAPNLMSISRAGTVFHTIDRFGNVIIRNKVDVPVLSPAVVAQTLASTGAVTFTVSNGDVQKVTLGANATSSTISASLSANRSQRITLIWTQDGTGSRTYAWPANCKFAGGAAPTPSILAGYSDIVSFVFDGTNWLEVARSVGVH